MQFLAPQAALIAAAVTVPLLVAMYFLKLRRRIVVVSSTLLWKRAVQEMQVNAPFQRLRRNLLLLLQLLILTALLLAMARPALPGQVFTGERLIILLDHSASMNATDVKPSRLDHAKQLAQQIVEDFDGAGGVMVVSFAEQARVVEPFTTDRKRLQYAIDSVRPTDQFSRLDRALQLVEPYANADNGSADGQAARVALCVLSDGRVHNSGQTLPAFGGGELRLIRIGGDTSPGAGNVNNVAIEAISVRRHDEEPHRAQIFARLANYGPQPVETTVTFTIDGQVHRVAEVSVPPATSETSGGAVVMADATLLRQAVVGVSHDHEDDLAADDAAFCVVAAPQRLRVLLVTGGNAFLERVIDAVGVGKRVTMTPKRYEDQDPAKLSRSGGGEEGFDVIVFDRYAPAQLPPVSSLCFNAAPPIDQLRLRPPADTQRVTVFLDWDRDHPLLRYVALDDVIVAGAAAISVPDRGRILATGPAGPMIAEVMIDGVQHVVVAFDLLTSNWPIQVSFAVFMDNAIHGLALGGQDAAAISYQPGDTVALPGAIDGTAIHYDGPAKLDAIVERGRAVLPAFERVGVYQTQANVAEPWQVLAVNLADPIESDLRPIDKLEVGRSAAQVAGGASAGRREMWRWFAWAALAVLLLEWLVYTRRMHL